VIAANVGRPIQNLTDAMNPESPMVDSDLKTQKLHLPFKNETNYAAQIIASVSQ
jgi:hypothetical protein